VEVLSASALRRQSADEVAEISGARVPALPVFPALLSERLRRLQPTLLREAARMHSGVAWTRLEQRLESESKVQQAACSGELSAPAPYATLREQGDAKAAESTDA
jgi:hypothetical protein